jgi:ABC-type dipeptide/oligopeptide/nickel transport system permease subunit
MEANLKEEKVSSGGVALASEITSATAGKVLDALNSSKHRSLWSDAFRRLIRNKLAVFGAAVILLLVITAVFAPFIAGYDYAAQNYDHLSQLPNDEFWFGTDQLGRDMFSRVVYGAQVSLLVGLISQIIALVIGVPVGMLAGYYGGKIDMILMRIVDVTYAFPQLLFVILLMSMLGPGLVNIFIALGLTSWVTLARLVRSEFLRLRESEFITAARALGVSSSRIVWRHLLPNALSPIIVAFTFGIPTAIFAEATLSFIGVGISPPTPSWGQMVGENYQYLRSLWHLAVFPVLAIALTMLGFSFFGDGLRDALDPRNSGDKSKLG